MITREAFAEYLMLCWYNNIIGEWGRKLAFKIQDELENEVIESLKRGQYDS